VAAGPWLSRIHDARARLAGVARRTPLHESAWLTGRAGVPVHLKLECWQRTHSFKFRGAYNAVASLADAARRRGLVTASAGNHGQAVALAARLHGARATVFVPETAPETKQRRIRAHGAELRLVAGSYDDAAAMARSFADASGATLVHPFADPDVVAGQGTVGLEILEDLPDVAQVVVPVGGGGLLAGVGFALAGHGGHGAAVLGVQSDATPAMHDAFEAGAVVRTPVVDTLCDGLAGETEAASFEWATQVTDGIRLVSEAAVAAAVRELFREEGVVAEGAGAVGVAAALGGLIPRAGPTAILISGGNIDMQVLARILSGED
jgi:threonine dehydratase